MDKDFRICLIKLLYSLALRLTYITFQFHQIMRILLLLFALAFTTCQMPGPSSDLVMCHDPGSAVDEFAMFASESEFRAAHPDPKPIKIINEGEVIEFPVEGQENGRGYRVMVDKNSQKYLLLFHEWWGLNDYVKREADMWSKELNVNVLAIDLYDGKVATTSEDAGKLMQANNAERSIALIKAAADFLGEKAEFSTMGWCFGGGWSLQASLVLEDKAKYCVMYYGMPEKDTDKLNKLSAKVLMIHPNKDKWITGEVVTQFQDNMKAADKSLEVYHFDADHAFANPSSPRYNEEHAVQARKYVHAFLENF